MGIPPDDPLDLAQQVCLAAASGAGHAATAGGTHPNALVAMAIESLGAHARSFTYMPG